MNDTPLKDDSIGRPGSPAASEEPDFGGGGGDIDFDVDTSGQHPPADADAGLSVDTTKDDHSSLDRRRSNLGDLEISGLEEDGSKTASEASKKKKKRKRTVGRKRMKKRRKIVIDNKI